MKVKILIVLCTLLLVACKDEAKEVREVAEPVPVISEGDVPSEDVNDDGTTSDGEVVEGTEDDQSSGADGTVSDPPPSTSAPVEDAVNYADDFWLDFDCGGSCDGVSFRSDLDVSSYSQIELPVSPAHLDSIDVVEISSETVASTFDVRYLANDIRVESLGGGMLKVTNNTSRQFSSVLVIHSTDLGAAPLKIKFDSILHGFSSVTYSGVPDGVFDYVETAPILNLDISYKGQSENCDDFIDSGGDWACVRNPTESEEDTLKALSANIKWFMNTYHIPEMLDAFAFGREYMGYTPSKTCSDFEACGVKFSVSENMMYYMFSLASAAHRMDVGKLEVSGRGWVGLGSGRMPFQYFGEGRSGWVGLTKTDILAKGNYITYMHELGHGMGYNHATGFTYGFPHFAGNYVFDLLGDKQVVESVPPEVFLSKGWRDGNLYLKVYSSEEPAEKKLNLQGLSMTAFDSVAFVSESGDTIKIEFSESPKQRFLVRVFSGESDLVMTKDVAPGMLMLDKRSTEDLLVINDSVLSEIVAKETLLNSRIQKSPRSLRTLCNKLFRQGDSLAIPTADALTMLSMSPSYYEAFQGEPFFALGGVENDTPGVFNFEDLVFTESPNNEPLAVTNLGCTKSTW